MSETYNTNTNLAPIDASIGVSGNRNILKELHDNGRNKHSPLNTKTSSDGAAASAANKSNTTLSSATVSPRLTMSNITDSVQEQKSTAAGTALHEFEKDVQLSMEPLYNAAEKKRLTNIFNGLTEFDEADIPDLPNSSGEMCDDPLRLTFDEGLMPNLSPNIVDTFNSTTYKKGTSTSDLTQLQIPTSDPDTALSSDNEIYAECLSYRDSEFNYELQTEMSETEHYRSALNTNENTADEDDNVNTTMENEAAIQPIDVNNLTPTLQSANENLNTQYPECEPMDVDMSSTLEMSNYSHNTTVEVDHVFGQQKMESKQTIAENLTENVAQIHDIGKKNFSVASEAENTVLNQETCEKLSNDKEKSISSTEEQQVVISINADCKAAAAIDKISIFCDDTENTIEKAKEESGIAVPSSEPTERELYKERVPPISTTSTPSTESKLSLLIDSVVSANISPKQSGQNSPNFPIKTVSEKSKFPSSPTALLERPPSFLEKSEYTEYTNSHIEKSTELITVKLTCTTPEKNMAAGDSCMEKSINEMFKEFKEKGDLAQQRIQAINTENNSNDQISLGANTTTNIGDHASPISKYNTTFDGTLSPSPNSIPVVFPVQTSAEKRRTFDVNSKSQDPLNNVSKDIENRRRTFNITAALNCNNETPVNTESDVYNTSVDKRRTFNVITPEPVLAEAPAIVKPIVETACNSDVQLGNQPLQQLNMSCEAMEVDESFSQLSNSSTQSPQQSQLQQIMTLSEMKTLSSSPPLPTRSSPLSMLINRPTICSAATAAAAQILSQSPPLPTSKQSTQIVEDAVKMPPPAISPRPIKKRSLNVLNNNNANVTDKLSAKEQTKSDSKDEKDIFVEKFASSSVEDIFTPTSSVNPFSASNVTGHLFGSEQFKTGLTDADFSSNSNLIFQQSDFDFLLSKGNNNAPIDRNSLLLRFDPLLGVPVPLNTSQQQQQALQQILQKAGTATGGVNTRLVAPSTCLSTTIAEEEQVQVQGDSNCAKIKETENITAQQQQQEQQKSDSQLAANTKHANMSVDVIKDINIDNDCTKSYEHSNTQSDEKQANFKMDELEKKIKNEVLKTEDIEKKLKEAEQREEALIKRITEKDKTISKMNGVIEAYEKAIAELIAEKEQLTHNYEKQLTEIKADRDSNYHHLTSLETTFSDLHVKYEKSKEMTSHLKSSEEALLNEKRQNLENLRMQEQRYEKMKNHAMQQLEIANKKLESMKKEHAMETTKLKAQLKKEEISRASINEQLQQKSRENEELVKICDELINGQGS